MKNNWLRHLIHQIVGDPSPLPPPPEPSLTEALATYQQSLDELTAAEQSLLTVLLVRDQVEALLQQAKIPTLAQAQQLVALDTRLRHQATGEPLKSLSNWRQSLHPPPSRWWWYLDEALREREKERDLLWELLAVTLFILTVPLVTDIIKRLWAHAPDNFAIVSSLLLLLVTASPFTSRGRELVQWLLKRVPRLPSHRRAEATAMTALLAFILVVVGRFLIMPQLARIYNDSGVAALEQGELTTARQQFQRAAAINKDFAVSYYNLAAMYDEVAQPDEAINWYRQAIAHNLELSPAYNNLGRLYLQQGEPEQALTVLQVGLDRLDNATPAPVGVVLPAESLTRYRLLTHLGQAYYELEQTEAAVQRLAEAIALEDSGELDVAFLAAGPHYYLALAYETLAYPADDIIAQWEAALSYPSADDPVDWESTIRAHLETWRQNRP